MKLLYPEEHFNCKNYLPVEVDYGFKFFSMQIGETVSKNSLLNNAIVFVLEGEINIKCNEQDEKKIEQFHTFLLAQSSSLYCQAITETKIIIFFFKGHISLLCENSDLSSYSSSSTDPIDELKIIKFNKPLLSFLNLLEIYLQAGVNCIHLHEIKKSELFLLFRTSYNKKDIYDFFSPILKADINFRSKVIKAYVFGYNRKKMSNLLNISTSHFARIFQKEFGITYYQWTIIQKKRYIVTNLAIPNITIQDITETLGFTSTSHFSRFCKTEFGCTPGDLSKQLKLKK